MWLRSSSDACNKSTATSHKITIADKYIPSKCICSIGRIIILWHKCLHTNYTGIVKSRMVHTNMCKLVLYCLYITHHFLLNFVLNITNVLWALCLNLNLLYHLNWKPSVKTLSMWGRQIYHTTCVSIYIKSYHTICVSIISKYTTLSVSIASDYTTLAV